MLFEEIYENCLKDVFRFCVSLTKDGTRAEELTQETFVKALGSIDTFDGSKDIRAWLFTIARNAYFSECRKQKRFAVDAEAEARADAGAKDIIEVLADRQSAELIHRYLHDMKEPYKEVFHLRVFGELGFDRIGSIFGKSANWARVTFFRAKSEIQNYMKKNMEGFYEE